MIPKPAIQGSSPSVHCDSPSCCSNPTDSHPSPRHFTSSNRLTHTRSRKPVKQKPLRHPFCAHEISLYHAPLVISCTYLRLFFAHLGVLSSLFSLLGVSLLSSLGPKCAIAFPTLFSTGLLCIVCLILRKGGKKGEQRAKASWWWKKEERKEGGV